jgi:hypothetical protein
MAAVMNAPRGNMAKQIPCPRRSKTFVAVTGAVAVLLLSAGCGGQRGGDAAGRPAGFPQGASQATKEQMHGGPSADQMKQIEEWKRTHPGASTRY